MNVRRPTLRVLRPLPLLLLAMLGVGCGTGSGAGSPSAPDPDGIVSAPGDSADSQPPTETPGAVGPLASLPLAPTDSPSDAVGDLVAVPWSLLGAVDDRSAVAISYGVSGCMAVDHVSVDEGADSVVLTVLLRETSAPDQPCSQSLMVVNQLVTLELPLGSRRLEHAPR